MLTFSLLAPLLPFVFVFGTIIGSFLNVVILRHEKEEGLGGRSYCPSCHKKLVWYELVPVFSYLLQGGRCRGCSVHISIQYPLVELLTGTIFVLVVATSGSTFSTGYSFLVTLLDLIIWSLLVVMLVYDFRTKLIPNRFSYVFALLALVSSLSAYLMYPPQTSVLPSLAVLLGAGPLLFLPFYLLWWYSEGKWIGLGDGKLALGLGWYLGLSEGATAIMLSFWIGAGVSLLIIGFQKLFSHTSLFSTTPYSLKTEIPFGPFLILGCGVAHFLSYSLFATL
jgi:prepilin signal peptidase PulO-like enzyme (type II secretory pathway)